MTETKLRDKFIRDWGNLLDQVSNLANVADANRRLLAGISTLLISKGVIGAEEIKKIENDVSSVMGQPYYRNKSRHKKKSTK